MHSSQEKTARKKQFLHRARGDFHCVRVFFFVPEQHERHCENLIAVINSTLPSSSFQVRGTHGQQVSPQVPRQPPGQQEIQRFMENITIFIQCIILHYITFVLLFREPVHHTIPQASCQPSVQQEMMRFSFILCSNGWNTAYFVQYIILQWLHVWIVVCIVLDHFQVCFRRGWKESQSLSPWRARHQRQFWCHFAFWLAWQQKTRKSIDEFKLIQAGFEKRSFPLNNNVSHAV